MGEHSIRSGRGVRRRSARLAVAVASVVLAAQALTGCTAEIQMKDLDTLVNGSPMTTFLSVRAAPAKTPYAKFDWATDGCSSGPIGSSPYDFTQQCWRHDFSYRNLKRIEAQTGKDTWNERNKYVADRRFQDDLKRRCETFSSIIRPTCNVAAEAFYNAVRLVEPYASDQTETDNPRNFRW
jgi:hypothetical protein